MFESSSKNGFAVPINPNPTDKGPVECPLKIGFVCAATPEIIKEVCDRACPYCNRVYNNYRDGFCRCLGYVPNDHPKHINKRVVA